MFDLHTFLMDTIHSMIGKEPEYRVRQYALGWYDKGVLDDRDLADIDDTYVAQEAAQNASEFTEEG